MVKKESCIFAVRLDCFGVAITDVTGQFKTKIVQHQDCSPSLNKRIKTARGLMNKVFAWSKDQGKE
jgi:hypothetical protein